MLAANGRGGLATVALRPSGIFGEGDPLLVPLTVAKAKEGKMKFIIGSGKNLMDFTYVGNVAQAHLQVLSSLSWHARSIPGPKHHSAAFLNLATVAKFRNKRCPAGISSPCIACLRL